MCVCVYYVFGIVLNNYAYYGARRGPLFSQYEMVFAKVE